MAAPSNRDNSSDKKFWDRCSKFLEKNLYLILLAPVVLIIILIAFYVCNFHSKPFSDSSSDWGTFGDYMGGTLNPILGFFSLIALLYTIKLQSDQIASNNKQVEFQQFENHFFQQLDGIRNIVSSLHLPQDSTLHLQLFEDITDPDKGKYEIKSPYAVTGQSTFIILQHNFISELNKKNDDNVQSHYKNMYYIYLHNMLAHYFRSIYTIIQYIDLYPSLDEETKNSYVHMVRAQISSSELYFLFYHGLSKWGKELKPLIEKYNFFKYLHPGDVAANDLIRYEKTAYGENSESSELLDAYEQAEASCSLHET